MRRKISVWIGAAIVVGAVAMSLMPATPARAAACLYPMGSAVTVAGIVEQYSSTDHAVLIATPAIKQCESQEIIVPLGDSGVDCQIGNILVATGLLTRERGSRYLELRDARDISCRERR